MIVFQFLSAIVDFRHKTELLRGTEAETGDSQHKGTMLTRLSLCSQYPNVPAGELDLAETNCPSDAAYRHPAQPKAVVAGLVS